MKISIITVCYNCSDVLRGCLESVARQTYHDVEHIIVDGASTDATVDVARQFPHVARILSEPDRGIYDAMNKGIALSTGDLIYFLNADDILASDSALADAVSLIEKDPAGDVYYGWLEVRPLKGSSVVYKPLGPSHAAEIMVTGCLPHQSTLARKTVFEKTGVFDLSYRFHADYDWFIKVIGDDNIVLKSLDCAIGSFREGGASSQLEKGQPEVFQIQASAPIYASREWDKRRIELLQEAWLAARIENGHLRAALDQSRGHLQNSSIGRFIRSLTWRDRLLNLLPARSRYALGRVWRWFVPR
ncbi:glycosyltransferase family 2 protein [Bosea massiliensis]|uniref:Glycosyltransferase family 2 protein n=1 Tax=Bosea massiliensis TaxID=151419 RepID=A0ABW0P8A3_9HYPH